MIIISDEQISVALKYEALIPALKEIFASAYQMPLRHHHFYKNKSGDDNTLILMPVWNEDYMGIKQVIVAPGNRDENLPAIHAQYTLLDTRTGVPLAFMNATELTARRTACTSALAASYLARKDAKTLLIVGGGSVAKHLVAAHAVVRDYENTYVWMRDPAKSQAFVTEAGRSGIRVVPVSDLESAARQADVITCATLSKTPLIKGSWLKPGTHLDLVGAHKPDTREADNHAIGLSSIFVDSRMGALHETGELAIPIATGLISENDVKADIVELVKGIHPGRTSEQEITLFKSAGLAVEDLAAALIIYRSQMHE
ncbi:ornithine cyclodeaminase family protein [Segetibacter sp. 3557_3]|uniref:ornithine cyclodeaminase family protein n=1 Tax=Segetibacter sp. 3557_3 TaxID=2547429 RepID=UPI001058A2D4|nr:ornithine cyclodeaminase family protein [Segetibacter sp. 3557_3]TDH28677.1 ornithine cyclodeaminase family protein [Segetibacter sp. 3557_3]